MKSLSEIRRQLTGGEFEFSRHAFRRVVERNISEQEIREAGVETEIIENYPDDKYGPSGLFLGLPRLDERCTFKYRLPNQI
jgi:hypothetical protein